MTDYGYDGSKFLCTRWIKNLFHPSIRTKAMTPDGKSMLYLDECALLEVGSDQQVKYDVNAFVLDGDNVLETTLKLPKIDNGSISNAVALHVQSVSPFHTEKTVFSWKMEETRLNGYTISIVIAAKDTINDFLSKIERAEEYELWYVNKEKKIYRFSDYGEKRRESIYNKYLALGVFLCVGITLALGVFLVTPTAQMRFRAIEAFHKYQALVDSTKMHVQKKNELIKTGEAARSLSELLTNKTDILKFLVFLTDALPDDTHVLNLEVTDLRVKLSGSTGNSNNLMKILGERPEVKNLRAPVPVTRQPGSSQEGFTLEFNLSSEVLSKMSTTFVTAESTTRSGQVN